MATNLYVWWNQSGNPPSPWQKVSSYNGKYFRCTTTVSGALGTGGSDTHTHSLGTGHTVGTTNDVTNINTTENITVSKSVGSGHNHAIGTTAIVAANNTPAYYTLSLISISLSEFMTNQRKLPKGAVVASTAAISTTGYSRVSAADGKIIKLDATPGSSSTTTTHTHSFSGSLSSYSGSWTAFVKWGSVVLQAYSAHSHALTGLSSNSQTILPARIQTRIYSVTSDPYNVTVPTGVVMFVDGDPSDYSDFLEIPSTWADRFIESANSNPTQTGSDVHNHGSSVTGNSDGSSASSAGGGASGSSQAMLLNHTHSLTVVLSSTDVSHLPPYVKFVPVKVIKDIVAQSTKTKTFTMDTVIKATKKKSYSINMTLLYPGSKFYYMKTTLKRTFSKGLSEDVLVANRKPKTYTKDLLIKRLGAAVPYHMGMEPLYLRGKRYSLGLTLAYRDIVPRYSVIDTLMDSWVEQYNKILQKIEAAKVGLKLDDATGYDLERKWGKTLNIKRDPGENDTEYRERIRAYTTSVMGCGTKATIKSLLDAATKGTSTKLDIFPGLIRINFTNDEQNQFALSHRTAIEKILNTAVAAGVEWILYFSYYKYSMDLALKKNDIPVRYLFDVFVSKEMYRNYGMDAELVFSMSKDYNMKFLSKKTCPRLWYMDSFVKKSCVSNYNVKSVLKKRLKGQYNMSAVLRRIYKSNVYMDMYMQKSVPKDYLLSMRIQTTEIKFYIMAVIMQRTADSSYGIGLTISEGS